MPGRKDQVGGEAFHLRDGYVWAEIYYLDSPTDYREWLPQRASTARVDSELVLLDSCGIRSSSQNALCKLPMWLSIISGVVLCVLVYTSF
jgi:hypothetical protein